MNKTCQQLAAMIVARVPRAQPPEDPPPTVAQWLARSKAAHWLYRKAHDDRQHEPAEAALQEAAWARAQAEQLDPDHTDVAWSDNGSTHVHAAATHDAYQEPLLRFYVQHLDLGRPGDPPIPPAQ